MPNDERQPPAPLAAEVANTRADMATALPSSLIAAGDPPPFAEPEALVQGMRYLQQRIPQFVQLTVRETRSMASAAHLDPEFVERGIHVAGVWSLAKTMIGYTDEELRQMSDEIRRWDEVVRELEVLTKGIRDANLQRKHRFGRAILGVYRLLGSYVSRTTDTAHTYLRPYFEAMQSAYLRPRKKAARARSGQEEDEK